MIGPFRARSLPPRRPTASRQLAVESLETRRLLAATDLEMLAELSPNAASTAPTELTNVSGTLFFSAMPNASNRELWKSDGTAAGTLQVKNINPGNNANSDPLQLTNIGGTLYFTAIDGTNGRELWKSDGTDAGTVMVKNIHPTGNAFGSAAATTTTPFANIGNTLFFSANDGTNGFQLWKSDGTAAGTVPVSALGASASPSNLTVIGNTLYFVATDTGGKRLWKTDAAGAAPTLVKDINTTGDEAVNFLTAVGNTLYFQANDGTTGVELWKSDGTQAGTVIAKDIRAGAATSSSFPNQLTNVGGVLYFTAINQGANRELWKSDGTAVGTVLVKEIRPNLDASSPTSLTNVSGMLFFSANDGTNVELWKSDGTAAGTVRVKGSHLPTAPTNLTNVAGTLYMTGTGGGFGAELWRSDGTDAGTALVKDLEAGTNGSSPTEITELFGHVVLVATTAATGSEIWHEPPASYGNFDQDVDVDGNDFLRWQRLLGSNDPSADADKSGTVDGADLAVWRSNFGSGGGAAAAAETAAAEATADVAVTGAFASNVLLSSDVFADGSDEQPASIQRPVEQATPAANDTALASWPSSGAQRTKASPHRGSDVLTNVGVTDDLWAEWPAVGSGLL